MRSFVISTIVFLTICGEVYSQNLPLDYDSKMFRTVRDEAFRDRIYSPLLSIDFEKFIGLKYYNFEKNYRIQAKFLKTSEKRIFLMPTSTGDSRKYLKIGDVNFKLDEKEFSLGVYFFENTTANSGQPQSIIDGFVPFKDLTNGEETYGGGRYVYFHLPQKDDTVILDFNIAFNPNCAYNTSYACTLPPKENSLQVEIKAGEKKFK